MDFTKGLQTAYNTKWSYVNTFTVEIGFATQIATHIGWDNGLSRDINLHIISIDTPQLTNQNIEAFIGNRWKIHNGRDELYRFSITFRDKDQMQLYSKFVKAYLYQKDHYFKDVSMTIGLFKDADYTDQHEKKIFNFEHVMIDSVSQVQFNNTTEAQIAEFSVDFKCAYPLALG